MGPVTLKGLRSGTTRMLTDDEIHVLKKAVGLI
jgi:hypothetical protein